MKGLKLYLQRLHKNQKLVLNTNQTVMFGGKKYNVSYINMSVIDTDFNENYKVNRIHIVGNMVQNFIPLINESWNNLHLHSSITRRLK